MTWEIKLIAHGRRTRPIRVGESPYLIGRHPACHVRLTDEQVSRRHCELTVTGDRLFIRDCGSRNGTRVNCQSLGTPAELRPGDVFRVGPFLFLVRQSDSQCRGEVVACCPCTGSGQPRAYTGPPRSETDSGRPHLGGNRGQ
jgi:DNA segregation ATPase FtsK/SpoIIIE, S-DNA-T family